jgi:hypothetical protein
MKLRNTREPYDEVEDSNEDRIAFLKDHCYEEVEEHAPSKRGAFGRKPDQPPADLGALADEISEDADAQ